MSSDSEIDSPPSSPLPIIDFDKIGFEMVEILNQDQTVFGYIFRNEEGFFHMYKVDRSSESDPEENFDTDSELGSFSENDIIEYSSNSSNSDEDCESVVESSKNELQ